MKQAGILCHISSLPGEYGIGTMGKEAYAFVDALHDAGVTLWQVLPLVQTGYGDSPYASVSCDSGNPYFIDLPTLKEEGLLTDRELKRAKIKGGKVDYGKLYCNRYPILRTAYSRFDVNSPAFRAFVFEGSAEEYALFMTAKTVHNQTCFLEWEEDLRFHRNDAVERLKREHCAEYLFWQFVQFEFSKQWNALKAYANEREVQIIGDIPLYVAYDSADVWSQPNLFCLDENLTPTTVAGVPPDYFSETGQLWGNPIYRWEYHAQSGYAWWIHRINRALKTYDYVRIDHFRGFDRYYEIPSDATTAIDGEWKQGPGMKLFSQLSDRARKRIIAEDLGTIDEGVRTLLSESKFPGMKVLLFAFDGNEDNDYLPENLTENSICYTGTHDNDTAMGYLSSLTEEERATLYKRMERSRKLVGLSPRIRKSKRGMCDAFLDFALNGACKIAIIPIQDLLYLGNESRMNTPGVDGGNWQFRLNALPTEKLQSFGEKLRNLRVK